VDFRDPLVRLRNLLRRNSFDAAPLGGGMMTLNAARPTEGMAAPHGIGFAAVVQGSGRGTAELVRQGAKAGGGLAKAVVPWVTLVTRTAYFGADIAMNAPSPGVTAVYAWSNAGIAVMGAAVGDRAPATTRRRAV
jgi:hypothetical protein